MTDGAKFPKQLIWGFSGVFRQFWAKVYLFSARNCYTNSLLFDYAHSVKISAQTDQNSQAAYLGVSERFGAFLGGVDLFSDRNCYIANLLFTYAHSVKISALADQNSQSDLFGRIRALLGVFGWG